MIDKELMNKIFTSYGKRGSEIVESIGLLNLVLEELLNDISNDTNKLLNKKEHIKVKECVDFHENICTILDENIDLIDCYEPELEENIKETTVLEEERDIPDYALYKVDNQIPHTLYEDFEYKRPVRFRLGVSVVDATSWKNILVKTCELLYFKDKVKFESFITDPSMQGRSRSNFSLNEDDLKNPKKLSNCEIYVETNFNANAIKGLIIKMLRKYGIKIGEFVVFFRADYTELNMKNK